MTEPFAIKICGLSTHAGVGAALDSGADLLGFVFFPPSPRHLDLATARVLGRGVGTRAAKVALSVDADDATLAAICEALAPDILQLHGHETPERVAAIRQRFGRPVMKAIGIAVAADLARATAYAGVADRLLFDAKPPKDANRPGGNGRAFDWALLAAASATSMPWMLSGGLTPDNVGQALAASGAPALDVSSGVETAPGQKDPALIADFVTRARKAALGLTQPNA